MRDRNSDKEEKSYFGKVLDYLKPPSDKADNQPENPTSLMESPYSESSDTLDSSDQFEQDTELLENEIEESQEPESYIEFYLEEFYPDSGLEITGLNKILERKNTEIAFTGLEEIDFGENRYISTNIAGNPWYVDLREELSMERIEKYILGKSGGFDPAYGAVKSELMSGVVLDDGVQFIDLSDLNLE